jgi:hypothetical protein
MLSDEFGCEPTTKRSSAISSHLIVVDFVPKRKMVLLSPSMSGSG